MVTKSKGSVRERELTKAVTQLVGQDEGSAKTRETAAGKDSLESRALIKELTATSPRRECGHCTNRGAGSSNIKSSSTLMGRKGNT